MKNTRRFTFENTYGVTVNGFDKTIESKENNRRTGFRFRLIQIICSLLLISFMANSVLAGSRPVIIAAGQIGQDISFGFSSNNYLAALGNWGNYFLGLLTAKTENRAVGRIEILPGGENLTVRQGEPVDFSAIAYSTEGNPLGGLKFDWRITDTGRNLSPHSLLNGRFLARAIGSFIVTVETAGSQAQINVTVVENQPHLIMKKIKSDEAKGKTDFINKLKNENRPLA